MSLLTRQRTSPLTTPTRRPGSVSALLVFGSLMLLPCSLIALVSAYVRRGFAKSLDAEGVRGAFGQRFSWGKLYYVGHVSKLITAGGVSRRIKDNQLELVFEGGKLVIPPLIHVRAEVWALVNRIPAEVRDDGVPRRAARARPASPRTGRQQNS